MRRTPALALALLAVALVAAAVARLLVGGPLAELGGPRASQVLELRAHHVVLGSVVGAALGVAGVMLQSLLRNPLAAPELLGLASGAGLAVTAASYVGFLGAGAAGPAGGLPAAQTGLAALAGSLGTLAVVYLLSQRGGFVDPVSLVLVGVIVSVTCGAGTMFLAHLMHDQGIMVARWTIGALDEEAGWTKMAVIGGVTVMAGVLGWVLGPAMDAAALSEDEARATGVAIGPLRMALFAAAGVLTAGAVVLAGPIGFVGLVCPHVVRLMAGPGHRVLIVGAALAGAGLVVGADVGVKALDLGRGRLPIGILTAIVGGPVFIALLRREAAGR